MSFSFSSTIIIIIVLLFGILSIVGIVGLIIYGLSRLMKKKNR